MRKKREIPLKKTRGRPKNSGLIVPPWAAKSVSELSQKSGVTAQKIIDVALRNGIHMVGEPLKNWIKYGESSEKLLQNEHVENAPKDHRSLSGSEAKTAFDDLELEPDELGTADTALDRLGDPDERPGHLEEVRTDNGSTQTHTGLTGE